MEINVSGSLYGLLKGIPKEKENLDKFIGLPICDDDGNIIGTVTDIDQVNEIWHGTITRDLSLTIKYTDGSSVVISRK